MLLECLEIFLKFLGRFKVRPLYFKLIRGDNQAGCLIPAVRKREIKKKEGTTMKKSRMKMLLFAGLCTVSVAGTSLVGYAATNSTDEETQTEEGRKPHGDGGVMAKITEVGDDTLTVILSSRPEAPAEKAADGETRPEKPADGETPPEKPADGETPPEMPADGETMPEKPADGETPPEKPADGETPPEMPADGENAPEKPADGESHMAMEFDGEAVSLTLTSETVITTGMDQTEGSVSDLEADSVVRLVLDGTTVVRIDIMEQ